MNKAVLLAKGKRQLFKAGLLLKKHSHEILTYGGIVGGIGAAVLACRATLKLEDTLETGKEEIDAVKTNFEYPEAPSKEERKELSIAYGRTTVDVVKLYLPAVTLGVASVASILAGHNIISKRSAAYAAAYTAVNDQLKGYRERVAARYGEDVEHELYYDMQDEDISTENPDGSVDTVTVKKPGVKGDSPFCRYFDKTILTWKNDAESNRFFLGRQQDSANRILKAQGFITLNEVYDLIGFKKTSAGIVAGWIYDEDNPLGDNQVDFGMYTDDEETRRFINGLEPSVLLDFNVDGDIFQKLD